MSEPTRSTAKAIFLAWLVAGCLDISSAFAIYLSKGIALTRGLQGIAIGLLGRETALHGGTATALLGLLLHFFIMLCWVLVFFAVSRLLPVLRKHPVISGIVYGPIVYIIMYWVVVPLSRIGPRPHSFSNDGLAVAIHICLIGLPIALIVSRFAPSGEAGAKIVGRRSSPPFT
jgi:hypothetical protein